MIATLDKKSPLELFGCDAVVEERVADNRIWVKILSEPDPIRMLVGGDEAEILEEGQEFEVGIIALPNMMPVAFVFPWQDDAEVMAHTEELADNVREERLSMCDCDEWREYGAYVAIGVKCPFCQSFLDIKEDNDESQKENKGIADEEIGTVCEQD